MITVKFYDTNLGTEDECVAIYTGNALNFIYGDIKLDDTIIATRQRCYDIDYFILESDYHKPNYKYGDARWLSRMTVEVVV